MRAWVIGAVMCVSSLASSIASAGGPGAIVIPPAEVEIGTATAVGAGAEQGPGPSTEFRVGAHWASLYWHPTRVDIGFGFVTSTRETFAATADRAIGPEDHSISLKGAYMSAAYAIENHRHWRTWVGGRLEMLSGNNDGRAMTTTGVAVRIATELYATGVAGVSDHKTAAFFAGAWALGVYVEGIHRGIPGEVSMIDASAGLTMRIPFILAVAD